MRSNEKKWKKVLKEKAEEIACNMNTTKLAPAPLPTVATLPQIVSFTKGNVKDQRSTSIAGAIESYLRSWLEDSMSGSAIDFELRPSDFGFTVPFDIKGCWFAATSAEALNLLNEHLENWLDLSGRRKHQIDVEVIPTESGYLIPFSIHGHEEWHSQNGWKPDVVLTPGDDKGLESLALTRRLQHARQELRATFKVFAASVSGQVPALRLKIRSGVCSWVESVCAFYAGTSYIQISQIVQIDTALPLKERQARAMAGISNCLKTLPVNAAKTRTRLIVVRGKIRAGVLCWLEVAKANYVNLPPDKVRNF